MFLYKKIKSFATDPEKFIKGVYLTDSAKKQPRDFDFFGPNWDREDEQLPLMVLWHFAEWKKEYIPNYFPKHKVVFVHKKESWKKTKNKLKKLASEHKIGEITFASWGNNLPKGAKKHARHNEIPTINIEDGFLRSFSLGSSHAKPLSLAFDKKGIYFNSRKPSDLEETLNNYDFENDKKLINKSKSAIKLFNAAKLSKYYNLTDQDNPKQVERESTHSILVVGQVEDDASIEYGATKNWNNLALIKKAKKDNPDADIYYRPHPDETSGNRKSKSKINAEKHGCFILDNNIALNDAIQAFDEVYTITSLVGLEALIAGKKVTVLGQPFYSGWGLTTDLDKKIKRRKRDLKLEELFAASYLIYPKYFHDHTHEEIDLFEQISYFFIEKIKYKDLFDIPENILNIEEIEKHKSLLSSPAKLLFYIRGTETSGLAETDEVMKIAKKNFNIRDFAQFSHILIQSANYNALKVYCDFALENVKNNIENYQNNIKLLESFFYHLAGCLKESNGRSFDQIADLSDYLINDRIINADEQKAVQNYLRCLSYNIQYEEIETSLHKLKDYKDDLKFNFWQKMTTILSQKPIRSERNHAKRNRLLREFAHLYKIGLTETYKSHFDLFVNTSLYGVAIDDDKIVIDAYQTYLSHFEKNNYMFSFKKLKKYGSLIKRGNHFVTIYKYLLKKGHHDVAASILKSFDKKENRPIMGMLWLEYFLTTGEYKKYVKKYANLSKAERNSDLILTRYAKALRSLEEFEKASSILTSYRDKLTTPEKRKAIESEIDKINFIIKSSEILNSYPQPKIPKGVVFIASQTCFNTIAMMIPSLVELKKKGYAVVNLTQGMLEASSTGIDFIDKFANIIPANFYFPEIKNSWNINWDKKIVSAKNINFHQGFYERLSTQHRTYYPDLNEPEINKNFKLQLKRSDTCLEVANQIFEDVVGKGIPVAFISGNSHVTPFSIFRDFCRDKDHPLLTFINCNIAYENYFSNLGSKYAHTMCVTDMTLYPNIRAPFMARRDQFENWYEKNKDNKEYLDQADKLIKVNRNSSNDNKTEQEIIKFLKEEKAKGKKILCAFGKIPVDLNVPYDGGPAHEDMADWINHTVKICGNSDNVILLVKPHPHELRPEIALDIQEGFIDLITEEVKGNVKLLGHRDINVHALAPYLDLAILYNGSSSLELTAQGIPVLMAAHFGRHDYPVDLIYPENRDQYAQYLSAGNYRIPDAELRKKSAFLIPYMGTSEISIFNDYSFRQVTNDRVGVPRWKDDKINDFLENGDPAMRLVADRIVEKFEKPANVEPKIKLVESSKESKKKLA